MRRLALAASLALPACTVDTAGVDPAESESESESEGGGEAGACPRLAPAELAACCSEVEGAPAHCAPAGAYPASATERFGPCGEGGLCVPDEVLEGGEGYVPPACTSVFDAPGACLSLCLPDVAEAVAQYGDLIPQDACRADQRCIPCADPTNDEPTGACDPLSCDEDAGGSEAESEDAWSCENPPPPGEPVVDPSAFAPCCLGGSCVPASLAGDAGEQGLGSCDAGGEAGYCVPDLFIETGGVFTLQSCASIGGIEGRCLSICLPDVAAQGSLPQGGCATSERCAPCCDPFTGEDTGACRLSCDTGPAADCATQAFPTCCADGGGHCVPTDVIPDDLEPNLLTMEPGKQGWECPPESRCVPDVLQDPDFAGAPCMANIIITTYNGVCVPDCLDFGWLGFAIVQGDCAAAWRCVPCNDPLSGGSTGAPGCPP